MTKYPLATVGAVIVAPDGEILLVRSNKWHNLWTIPGGKIEMGESTEKALVREVKEETNLDVINPRFINTQDCIFSEQFYLPKHFIFHDFVCYLADSKHKGDVVLNEEAQEYVWLTPEQAAAYPLTKQMRYLLNKYIAEVQKKS